MTTTTAPASALRDRLQAFMDSDVYPNEHVYEEQLRSGPTPWMQPPIMDELQAKARALGLWNLFLPEHSGKLRFFYEVWLSLSLMEAEGHLHL